MRAGVKSHEENRKLEKNPKETFFFFQTFTRESHPLSSFLQKERRSQKKALEIRLVNAASCKLQINIMALNYLSVNGYLILF